MYAIRSYYALETIAKMQPSMVAGLLEREHPQTLALVLSTQSIEHAGAIIAKLPEEKRADVVYRIATLDAVSPAVIDRIEEALNKEIGRITSYNVCYTKLLRFRLVATCMDRWCDDCQQVGRDLPVSSK